MTIYLVVLAALAVVAVGALLLFSTGRLDGTAPVTHDEAPRPSVEFPVTAGELSQVQFAVRFRGYDMDEVDELIDSLVEQLAYAKAQPEVDLASVGAIARTTAPQPIYQAPQAPEPTTPAVPVPPPAVPFAQAQFAPPPAAEADPPTAPLAPTAAPESDTEHPTAFLARDFGTPPTGPTE